MAKSEPGVYYDTVYKLTNVSNESTTNDTGLYPKLMKLRSWVSKENLIYDNGDTTAKLQPFRKKLVAATPTEKMLEKENNELRQKNVILRQKLEKIEKSQGRGIYGQPHPYDYEVSRFLFNLITTTVQTFLHVKV